VRSTCSTHSQQSNQKGGSCDTPL